MDSVFIVDEEGEVVIERHAVGSSLINRKRTKRILDTFKDELLKARSQGTVPLPVIPTPQMAPDVTSILCSEREGLFLVSPVCKEVEPLLMMEFVLRIWDTFESYFGSLSEDIIKSNFLVVQLLLDEVMDNGMPFNTELNVLTDLIYPPDFIQRKIQIDLKYPFKSMVAPDVPSGYFSATPWRKNARYAANEILVDVLEEIDCTMDCNAYVDRCEIFGEVAVHSRLSGMPTIELEFNRPEMLYDASLHRCVLIKTFDNTRVVRFVPPDGKFVLMNYRIKGQLNSPVLVRPKYEEHEITVLVEIKEKVENLILTIPWDKELFSSVVSVTKGSFKFDEYDQVCRWSLGSLEKPDPQKGIAATKLKLHAHLPREVAVRKLFTNPIRVDFNLKSALSGLRVQSLTIHGENYLRPFKGLKATAKAGNFYVQPNSLTNPGKG